MDYVADLAEVVRLTARRKLSVCGHSMGGGIAAYYAGVFPERVQRLAVLEGVNAPEQPMGPARTAAWIAGWMKVVDAADRPGHASVAAIRHTVWATPSGAAKSYNAGCSSVADTSSSTAALAR